MTIRVVEHEGGWLQVDIRVRLPDGTRYRERLKAPVQSKSAARRWAEERERYLALNGPKQPKKEVPTLEDFESRFISEHVEANQLKPSTAASYKSRLKLHIRPGPRAAPARRNRQAIRTAAQGRHEAVRSRNDQ